MKKFNAPVRIGMSILFLSLSLHTFSQTSYVDVTVNWPNWSSENRVEVYNPSGTLISTIDNGYSGCCNNSYSTTVSLGCLTDAANYYIIMYDTYGDGWNGGASNVTVTSGGTTVITNSGAGTNSTGTTIFFNVSGGCSGTCSSTVATFPYSEDFETGIGAWTQDTTDNADWTRQTNGTPSGPTGPSGANGGSYYLFTESSNPNFNYTFNLKSPCFNLTSATTAQFSFYYHMYGANMGTLNVELSTDNGLTFPTSLWSQTGQVQTSNGDAWNLVNIDLTPYVGQTITIRFRGVTGSSWRSDMAIDDISLTATTSGPEINILGNATTIADGDTTPSTTDDTDYGSLGAGGTLDRTFTIQNTGTTNLNLTGTPIVNISGDAAFTILTQPTGATIAASGSLTFVARFAPTINGTVQAIISIDNNDSNENPYNFTIQGKGVAPLTEGPGGVTADLELWLKGTDGLSYTDGQSVSTWLDQGRGANATVNTVGQEPTYKDNITDNINFNPVVDFDNSYNPVPIDGDFSFDDTTTQFLEGTNGF
ncbi:MAG: choice-of-anchor D domain-containing protein, partial [Chlorobi bacterium]|nr:choice-of-anchor D domain-containing protein [Chlorobiota bacterium]